MPVSSCVLACADVTAIELNLDGLVGPTHNFGGAASGNLASASSAGGSSRPRAAALEGLKKMQTLSALGLPQALMPPQYRPELSVARKLGFNGGEAQALSAIAREEPMLLAACYSAASMWTANAATVSPSADSADGRVHFTPANLQAQLHRSIEAEATQSILQAIFHSEAHFCHHGPLPATGTLGDEGAANHCRFAPSHGAPGVQLFVYGRSATDPFREHPERFIARHTEEASRTLARLHQLDPRHVVFAQQNPEVVDLGVFHNDVISVSDEGCFFLHERAFLEQEAVLAELKDKYEHRCGGELQLITVKESEVSVADAVCSYLFNSQLVRLPSGERALIAPKQCEQFDSTRAYLEGCLARGAFDQVHYLDLGQSMMGGGGPACLRLRVVLNEAERAAMNPAVLLDGPRYAQLEAWVMRHYREELALSDLADPQLMRETQTALDELSQLLQLGSIYPFQSAATKRA